MHDEQDIPWSGMCVIYRSNWVGKQLQARFSSVMEPRIAPSNGSANQARELCVLFKLFTNNLAHDFRGQWHVISREMSP